MQLICSEFFEWSFKSRPYFLACNEKVCIIVVLYFSHNFRLMDTLGTGRNLENFYRRAYPRAIQMVYLMQLQTINYK